MKLVILIAMVAGITILAIRQWKIHKLKKQIEANRKKIEEKLKQMFGGN